MTWTAARHSRATCGTDDRRAASIAAAWAAGTTPGGIGQKGRPGAALELMEVKTLRLLLLDEVALVVEALDLGVLAQADDQVLLGLARRDRCST